MAKPKLRIQYIKTAVFQQDWPDSFVPEIALAGRSNAGKSSMLNSIAGREVAYVSKRPGKTATLNFFDVNGKYSFVDMPGFGYSEKSQELMREWTEMVELFVSTRDQLVGLILLMDIRREVGDLERAFVAWAHHHGKEATLVLTKSDKIRKVDIEKACQAARRALPLVEVHPVSSFTGEGIDAMEDWVFRNWIKPLVLAKVPAHSTPAKGGA